MSPLKNLAVKMARKKKAEEVDPEIKNVVDYYRDPTNTTITETEEVKRSQAPIYDIDALVMEVSETAPNWNPGPTYSESCLRWITLETIRKLQEAEKRMFRIPWSQEE